MNRNTLLLLAALLVPAAAAAQDELGLDLSEDKTPAEFRPSIAFIGVTPDAAEEVVAGRAKLLEPELLKAIKDSERFGTVKTPVDVAGVSTTARKCREFACLEELAEKLGVNRIVTATLAKAGPGTVLSVQGFDPTLPSVLPLQVESAEKSDSAKMGGFSGIAGKSQGQRDKEFLNRVRNPFNELLKNLGTPLGKISIDVIEQRAVTRVKGKELGTGSFDKTVPVGSYELEVTADDYLPFTTTVTVAATKTSEVKVTLAAKPLDHPVGPISKNESAAPAYKRPGLYIALLGAVALGVGLGFGGMAKSTENAAVDADHDGIVDITRSQANTAKTQALLANILMASGGVLMGAGLIWFFVTPAFSKGAPAPTAPGEPEGAGFGFLTGMGGTF